MNSTSQELAEILGFLHDFAPHTIQALATEFPEDASLGHFERGVVLGEDSSSRLAVLATQLKAYPELATQIPRALSKIERRLRRFDRLEFVFLAISVISSTSLIVNLATAMSWVAIALASLNLISLIVAIYVSNWRKSDGTNLIQARARLQMALPILQSEYETLRTMSTMGVTDERIEGRLALLSNAASICNELRATHSDLFAD